MCQQDIKYPFAKSQASSVSWRYPCMHHCCFCLPWYTILSGCFWVIVTEHQAVVVQVCQQLVRFIIVWSAYKQLVFKRNGCLKMFIIYAGKHPSLSLSLSLSLTSSLSPSPLQPFSSTHPSACSSSSNSYSFYPPSITSYFSLLATPAPSWQQKYFQLSLVPTEAFLASGHFAIPSLFYLAAILSA